MYAMRKNYQNAEAIKVMRDLTLKASWNDRWWGESMRRNAIK